MTSVGAIWGPLALRHLRGVLSKTTKVVRAKLAAATRPAQGELQRIPVQAGRQSTHPVALLKQQKRGVRWFSSSTAKNIDRTVRRFMSSESGSATSRFDGSKLPVSNTSRRVAQFSGRAPFASTLRPNLTGGALPRSAGGYGLGGGARYFSHTPAAPAQVVQNVSQAMRAFFLSGQKIRYDGLDAHGKRQYRAVSAEEDTAMKKLANIPRFAPGAFVDFKLSPTVTAVSPLAAGAPKPVSSKAFKHEATDAAPSLNTEGFFDVLSNDFDRAARDLAAVYADLRRLAVLGDLPINLESNNMIRVRFPGIDAATAERLCDDIGIQRGMVGEDPDWNIMVGASTALMFPFAPEKTKSVIAPAVSERSLDGFQPAESSLLDDEYVHEAFMDEFAESPWLSDPEGYVSMSPSLSSGEHCSQYSDGSGLEGIYRFLEECDRAKGKVA